MTSAKIFIACVEVCGTSNFQKINKKNKIPNCSKSRRIFKNSKLLWIFRNCSKLPISGCDSISKFVLICTNMFRCVGVFSTFDYVSFNKKKFLFREQRAQYTPHHVLLLFGNLILRLLWLGDVQSMEVRFLMILNPNWNM